MSTKNSKKQAIDSAIGIGAISQMSRNTKVKNAGETLLIFALISAISEIIKFIIFKPIVLIIKWFWKLIVFMAKTVYYYIPKISFQLCKKVYKMIKKTV